MSWKHDDHVTARVAMPCVAVVLVLTSATFAGIVWSVMLMMIVCVPSLSALAGLFLVLNYRAGGTWRPRDRRTLPRLPRRQVAAVKRPAVAGRPPVELVSSRRVMPLNAKVDD